MSESGIRGEDHLRHGITERLHWAILPRHGTVAWADTLWNAFLRIEGLEHAAKIVMTARSAGSIEPLSQDRRLELLTLWGLEHLDVPCDH